MKQGFANQTESFRNPYRESRDRAGMSQEAAAEALHISTRTLWSYETTIRPTDETVMSMAELYQDPYLEYEHLRLSPIGKKILPVIDRGGVSRAVICYQAGINIMRSHESDMIQVAYDDRIDNHELPVWRKIQRGALMCAGSLFSLALQPIEKVASVAAPATSREKHYHR